MSSRSITHISVAGASHIVRRPDVGRAGRVVYRQACQNAGVPARRRGLGLAFCFEPLVIHSRQARTLS